jgi:ribosomal protein S18 acetylase RimI-like enzyme
MAAVRVRQATPEEISALIPDARDRSYFHRRVNRAGSEHGRVLVAFLDDVFAGHIYVRFHAATERKIRLLLPGVPLLQRLKVLPQFQRQGVGETLVREAIALLRELKTYDRVALGVAETNEPALQLYTKLGFADWKHGTVLTHDDAGRPEQCQVWVKEL